DPHPGVGAEVEIPRGVVRLASGGGDHHVPVAVAAVDQRGTSGATNAPPDRGQQQRRGVRAVDELGPGEVPQVPVLAVARDVSPYVLPLPVSGRILRVVPVNHRRSLPYRCVAFGTPMSTRTVVVSTPDVFWRSYLPSVRR